MMHHENFYSFLILEILMFYKLLAVLFKIINDNLPLEFKL